MTASVSERGNTTSHRTPVLTIHPTLITTEKASANNACMTSCPSFPYIVVLFAYLGTKKEPEVEKCYGFLSVAFLYVVRLTVTEDFSE